MSSFPVIIPSAVIAVIAIWNLVLRLINGLIKMTRPSIIYYFENGKAVILISTRVYTTTDKGRHVEYMNIQVIRGGNTQDFTEWKYIHDGNVMSAGFFTNKEKPATHYYFGVSLLDEGYKFLPGEYLVQFFIKCEGKKRKSLRKEKFLLTKDLADSLNVNGQAIIFTWSPVDGKYNGRVILINGEVQKLLSGGN